MELIKLNHNNINIPDGIVACIGVFDGVHNGHDKVINSVKCNASKYNLKTALITFDPHPDYVLGKVENEQYITPLNERFKIIESKYNLDYFIVIDFTEYLSRLSYEDFYKLYLSNIEIIVIGEGFRFGYKNQGTVSELERLHLNKDTNKVISVKHECYDDDCEKISSQDIVSLLKKAQISKIKSLGVNYTILGKVVKGSQIGNKIGYPTANIDIQDKYHPIKNGVYAVIITIDGMSYLGIANYGYNPSFNKIDKPRLEVHIFEFNNNIYDKNVEVEFIDYLRDEMNFSSIDDFLKQLNIDCNKCIKKYGGKYETINCRGNG